MSDSPIETPQDSVLERGDGNGRSDADKIAPSNVDVADAIEKAPGDAMNVDYDKLLRDEERKEENYFDEMIDAENDEIAEEGHELGEVVQGDYTDDKLKQMRSLYVEDKQGNSFHKKNLLFNINTGVSLSKSTDRTKRVRGDSKFGGRKKDKGTTTSVMRAFSHNRSGPNSGDNRHCLGDFCCVMIAPNNNFQHQYMVIGKFLRFGNSSCPSPLELQWPLDSEQFDASILVCEVTTHVDVENELCLCAKGNSIVTLQCVQSSCFAPILPNLEESAEGDGTFTTTAVIKMSYLTTVFEELSKGNLHKLKNTISLPPIKVDGKFRFVAMPTSLHSTHLPVCSLCQPPKKIGKKTDDDTAIQRALRNHAASHLLLAKTAVSGEPCGLCCGMSCTLGVDTPISNLKSILENESETVTEIRPSATVKIGCRSFPKYGTFQYKFCRDVVAYPSTNKPILCLDCSSPTSTLFLWTYNIKNHYNEYHSGFSENVAKKYKRYEMKSSEKEKIINMFPINTP